MNAAAVPLIREMGPADVGAVARLEAQSYEFPWSEGIFRDCLRAGYYCCLAEDDGGGCVGYAVLSIGAGEAHVLNLCVAEAHRGHGIGGHLLQQVTHHAAESGAREIYLEVRPSNTAALHLYQARGFNRIGVRKGYYQAHGGREDAVVLRRNLPPGGG